MSLVIVDASVVSEDVGFEAEEGVAPQEAVDPWLHPGTSA